ncbi:MAG: amidohydrolase family protein [Methyloligellaceae bacterium]
MVKRSENHEWLESRTEEAIEPELPICDPHHHLWDYREIATQHCYMLDEVLEDVSGGHNIVSTVFIECGAKYRQDGPEAFRYVGETEFVNDIAEQAASGAHGPTQIAAGIIGTVDLRIGDEAADVLDAQIEAGNGRFRGVRLGALWHEMPNVRNHRINPPEHMLLHDDFRSGFKHLASRNMSFEVWCCHPQIPDATDLARAFPDTVIVLNHFGGPLGIGPYEGKGTQVFEDWKTMIGELATCQNVVVKLGGINMDINGYGWETRPLPPTSSEHVQATRRYFEHTIETFGVNRCMFESNFPVDKFSISYTTVWNSAKKISQGYSAAERAALFHDTAARVYRL